MPWALVLLAATALGFVLIIIRLIIGYDPTSRVRKSMLT